MDSVQFLVSSFLKGISLYWAPLVLAFVFTLSYKFSARKLPTYKIITIGVIGIFASTVVTTFFSSNYYDGSDLIGITTALASLFSLIGSIYILLAFGGRNKVYLLASIISSKSIIAAVIGLIIIISSKSGDFGPLAYCLTEVTILVALIFIFRSLIYKKNIIALILLCEDIIKIVVFLIEKFVFPYIMSDMDMDSYNSLSWIWDLGSSIWISIYIGIPISAIILTTIYAMDLQTKDSL